MSKEEVIFRYKASMSVFKNWLDCGVISKSDLLAVSTTLARKYGLSLFSIFLETDLLCKKNRANIR